jgi:hypothetical protein
MPFLHPRGRACPPWLAPVDTFPEHRQLCRGQRHFAFRGLRPREMTALQNLVVKAKSLAIPVQDLQPVAHPAAKHKDRPTGRILFKQPLGTGTQTRNPATHVGDTRRKENADAIAGTDHALSRTRINCARPAAESPSIPRSSRPFASTISTIDGMGAGIAAGVAEAAEISADVQRPSKPLAASHTFRKRRR